MSSKGRGVQGISADAYPTPPWCVTRLLEVIGHSLPTDSDWLEPAFGMGHLAKAVNRWAFPNTGHDPHWYGCDLQEAPRGAGLMLDGWHQGDYLQAGLIGSLVQWPFSVGITNPPFTIFFEYARKLLAECHDVILLGRLNVLGSGKKSGRSVWLREHAPDVYVLPDRPVYAHKMQCERHDAKLKAAQCKGVMVAYDEPTPELIDCGCMQPITGMKWEVDLGPWPVAKRTASSDSTEYAWFHWPAGQHDRKQGTWGILENTPSTERVDRVIP